MARNYRELQERMDPASRAENKRRVGEELQRMALDELRNAKRLTQAELAEILDVPQSSISRIEQRADMYLSTLRNYIHAMGGVLQIQAVFPDGAVTIDRFGEYENRAYEVDVHKAVGKYWLDARPIGDGPRLYLKPTALRKTLAALGVSEGQIGQIMEAAAVGIVTPIRGHGSSRIFTLPDLLGAGFVEVTEEPRP
jgi:DNA-binding XRE family transcriptional regulator